MIASDISAKGDPAMTLQVATIYNSIGGNEYTTGNYERGKNFFEKSIALKVKMLGRYASEVHGNT